MVFIQVIFFRNYHFSCPFVPNNGKVQPFIIMIIIIIIVIIIIIIIIIIILYSTIHIYIS